MNLESSPVHPAAEAPDPARQALCMALAELDAAECSAQPFALSHALAQVGRCYRGLSAHADAESHLERALRWAWHAGSTDHLVDVLCELSETSVSLAEIAEQHAPGSGRAARERARDRAYEAAQRAGIVSDPRWEVQVLLRVSDVLDRCGDHDDATALQVRALRLMMGEYAGAPLLAAMPMPPGAPTH